MAEVTSIKEMLNAFQKAWSNQDIPRIISFFADELQFEDIPIGLYATNKVELEDILKETFKGVPDFKMEIYEFHEGNGFVVTKWKQSGTMTISGYGLELKDFAYETKTTSIIQFNEVGLITSVSDNWNTGIFYQ
ncbi:MAG: nuclear transport factor 2 family protein [Bacteroidota bacterium]